MNEEEFEDLTKLKKACVLYKKALDLIGDCCMCPEGWEEEQEADKLFQEVTGKEIEDYEF